jgi:soluble lytic murein transglycosylase
LKLETVHPLIEFRDNIYTKQFNIASSKIDSILEDKNNYLPQIFSDIGKAFLYKSNEHLRNAIYLDSKLEEVPDECKFYLLFYSGRLYDKSNDYKTKASLRFKSAMELARDKLKNNSLQDNALWYYFNTCLKISIDKTIFALEENINEIHDPYYFDDFFDTLSLRLISEHQWEKFFTVTKILNTNVSSETRAKFNYISARLIEEKFINSPNEISLSELYNIALQSESDIYYKLMAAKKLNLPEEELKENIFSIGKKSKLKINLEAEKLLYGYTDFGLTKYIYPEWTKYSNQISMECTERIADYLQRYANFSIEYFPLSLRIASKKTFSPEKKLSKRLLELSFPKNFKKEIEENLHITRILALTPEHICGKLVNES